MLKIKGLLVVSCLLVVMGAVAWGAEGDGPVPMTISIQGRVTQTAGQPAAGKSLTFKIGENKIVVPAWSGANNLTNEDGVFNAVLDFTSLFVDGATGPTQRTDGHIYVYIFVDGSEVGAQPLHAVPFAFFARQLGSGEEFVKKTGDTMSGMLTVEAETHVRATTHTKFLHVGEGTGPAPLFTMPQAPDWLADLTGAMLADISAMDFRLTQIESVPILPDLSGYMRVGDSISWASITNPPTFLTSADLAGYSFATQDWTDSRISSATSILLSETTARGIFALQAGNVTIDNISDYAVAGPAGPAGPQGPTGPAGLDGAIGSIGPEGLRGLQGAAGPQGLQGLSGIDGAIGPIGPEGPLVPLEEMSGQITTGQIANLAIGTLQLAAESVGTLKLKDGAVTDAKIDTAGISANKISGTFSAAQTIPSGPSLPTAGTSYAGGYPLGSFFNLTTTSGSYSPSLYQNVPGGSWHKVASTLDLSWSNLSVAAGLGPMAQKSSLAPADIPNLDASKIIAGTFASAQIADGAITGPKIATGAVTGTNIAAATITGAKLAASTVTGANIAASTITGAKLAGSTITGANIAAATITGAKLAASTVTGANIAASTITGAKLAGSTITAAHIGTGEVTDTKIATGISASKMTTGAISSALLIGGTDKVIAAYGVILANGSIAASSGNITSIWNSANSWYEITITGISFDGRDQLALVTPSSNLGPLIPATDSLNGKLLVFFYNTSGQQVQLPTAGSRTFHFIVIKP